VVIAPKADAAEQHRENFWIRDGVCVIPKGAVIPDGTRIE
jgi:hypothetical protein